MRWYVLGRGSVGCLWASNLARAGHAVTLLVRPGGADAPRVTINVEEAWEGSAGCRWQQQVELEEPGTGQGTIQRLLVATKAQDAGAGVASLASRLAPSPTVVLLQNGLGASDDILAHEALQSVDPLLFVGSTTQGSYLRQPYDIVHAGNGVTWLGIAQATIGTAREQGGDRPADVEAEFRSVVESLSTSALGSVVLESPAAMEGRIWGKLAINAALNPLTALLRCRNGEIIATQHGRDVIHACSQEVAQVMAARGLRTMRGDAEGDVEELGAALEAFVVDAAERNARNYSSMYQDAAGGRPTEVGYINGAVIRAAEEHGVPVPCNRLLLQQMRMLEALGAFEKQPKA